jgi:hypothetical protein
MTHRQAVARPLAGRLRGRPPSPAAQRSDRLGAGRAVAHAPRPRAARSGPRSCRRCARDAPSAAARASTSWTRGPLDRARAGLADRGAGACAGRAGPGPASPRPRAKTRVRYRRPPGTAWDELDRDAAMDRHLPTRTQRSNRRPTAATLGSASQAVAAGEKARRGKSGHRRARWSGHRPGETRGKVPQKHTADGEASRGSRTGKGEMVR